MLISNYS